MRGCEERKTPFAVCEIANWSIILEISVENPYGEIAKN